jgi:hypothetical protein
LQSFAKEKAHGFFPLSSFVGRKDERRKKLIFFCGEMRFTVFDDEEQMRTHQRREGSRQHPDVTGEEAL